MKLLSIDVGIKNLALCLFNVENKEKYEILNWDVVNLCNEIDVKCFMCSKSAKFINKEIFRWFSYRIVIRLIKNWK